MREAEEEKEEEEEEEAICLWFTLAIAARLAMDGESEREFVESFDGETEPEPYLYEPEYTEEELQVLMLSGQGERLAPGQQSCKSPRG